MSNICVPIQAKTLAELKVKIAAASRYADTIEVWADQLPLTIAARDVLALTKKPLLMVYKKRGARGLAILHSYAQAGVAYIDIDLKMGKQFKKMAATTGANKKKKTQLILSYHHFTRTPTLAALTKIVRKGFMMGADIVKIATFAQNMDDNLTIFNLLKTFKGRKIIAHCMGEQGKISRVLSPAFGSYITYVALDAKSKTAPGQLTFTEHQQLSKLLNLQSS